MSLYTDEITRAMTWLGTQDNTVFVGQSVKYSGQALFKTFSGVPDHKKIEMPVAEDFQLGFCTGLSLMGYVPICFYPRMDFLVLAMNQLVNHLDKIPLMSDFKPKVIIRVAVGDTEPLDPGPQHTQDHSVSLRNMLNTIDVLRIHRAEDAMSIYTQAIESAGNFIVVEYMERHR